MHSCNALGAQVECIFQFGLVHRESSICAGIPLQCENGVTGALRKRNNQEVQECTPDLSYHINTGGPCPYHVDLLNTCFSASNTYHYLILNMLRDKGCEIKFCDEK